MHRTLTTLAATCAAAATLAGAAAAKEPPTPPTPAPVEEPAPVEQAPETAAPPAAPAPVPAPSAPPNAPPAVVEEPSATRESFPRVVSWTIGGIIITRPRCRSWVVRPARAVRPGATPRYGQLRVRRGADGRWWGYTDRWRLNVAFRSDGSRRVRASLIRGTWCSPSLPAVAG